MSVIPCSESLWLHDAILDHLKRSGTRVSRTELEAVFGKVDESLVIGELRCLKENGKIRALYDDMTCFFEIV